MVEGFLFVLGLIFGSFINAFLYRYQVKKSMMGRSFCPLCKHKLFWYDNIPIFSWFMLKAKCRYCKSSISIQYPLVELLAGFITLSVAWKTGFLEVLNNYIFHLQPLNYLTILQFSILNSIFLVLLTISIYDIKNKEIPNGFNLTFVLISLVYLVINNLINIPSVIPYLLSGGLAFLFFFTFVYFSKETWMGGGDAKFAFGIGVLLGPVFTFLAILVASWTGAVYGISIIGYEKFERKKIRNAKDLQKNIKKHEIPFGPFLALGCLVSFLFGSQIVAWYAKIFLGF